MTEGRVIHGRYRLLSRLGQGGMGSVWRAVHIELGTPVAVKLIDPAFADSKLALSRFKREAQSAASLRCTNVVQIFDYGVEEAIPYIVMELLEGESLGVRLARQAPLSPLETSQILGQVGRALVRAHAQNIVHRDLKPDNIFIVRDGDEEVTKVLDFGIAKTLSKTAFEASIQTKSGAILGTPHYMSPEQASGRSTVDHRADIWSLGVIGFECLTGCRPFNGSTLGGLVIAICAEPIPLPSQVGPVPRGLDEWFARCACRDQAGRFQSIADAIGALRIVCEAPVVAGSADAGWVNGREPTLHNSHNPSMRVPSAPAIHASMPTAKSENPETVSAASRTLGATQKRRSVFAYVALALLLLGGGAASAIGLSWRIPPPAASSTSTVAGSRDASLVPSAGTTPPVEIKEPALSSPPVPQPPTNVTQLTTLPVVALRLPSSKPLGVLVATPAAAPSAMPLPSGAPVPEVDTASLPSAPVAEPATRPDPAPADTSNPPRRRNVEDRLAF
jgi:eukaryotic-like serine/threonine-protein kinase